MAVSFHIKPNSMRRSEWPPAATLVDTADCNSWTQPPWSSVTGNTKVGLWHKLVIPAHRKLKQQDYYELEASLAPKGVRDQLGLLSELTSSPPLPTKRKRKSSVCGHINNVLVASWLGDLTQPYTMLIMVLWYFRSQQNVRAKLKTVVQIWFGVTVQLT